MSLLRSSPLVLSFQVLAIYILLPQKQTTFNKNVCLMMQHSVTLFLNFFFFIMDVQWHYYTCKQYIQRH